MNIGGGTVPLVIFAFWTGRDRMSRRRRLALKTLERRSGVHVELVTSGPSLDSWVVEGDPLHAAYPYLSSTHRSDYLRSYFMYHHGGGYADIKPVSWRWHPFFEQLDTDTVDFYGSPEQEPAAIAGDATMQANYRKLVSNCAFIFRKKTSFAAEWKARVSMALDKHLDAVKRYPGTYHPRAVKSGIHGYGRLDFRRGPRGYPLRWAEIQGEIFHPLQYENLQSFRPVLPPLTFGPYR